MKWKIFGIAASFLLILVTSYIIFEDVIYSQKWLGRPFSPRDISLNTRFNCKEILGVESGISDGEVLGVIYRSGDSELQARVENRRIYVEIRVNSEKKWKGDGLVYEDTGILITPNGIGVSGSNDATFLINKKIGLAVWSGEPHLSPDETFIKTKYFSCN